MKRAGHQLGQVLRDAIRLSRAGHELLCSFKFMKIDIDFTLE